MKVFSAQLFKKICFVLIAIFFSTELFSQVATYTFTQSAGTYVGITGGTVLGDAATDDDNFLGLQIGFPFFYNGQSFTTFSVNANGYIVMGNAGNSSHTVLSSGMNNRVMSALNYDLLSRHGAELSYATLGVAPNRTLLVQWSNYTSFNDTTDTLNFQIRLNETLCSIDFEYGHFRTDTSLFAQVGLRGNANSDFNNRYVSDTINTWATSTAGALNTATCKLDSAFSPTSGQTYSWAPPAPPAVPITMSFSAITPTGMTVKWVDNSTSETSFLVYRSTDNVNFSLIGTVATVSMATTGSTDSIIQTGLLTAATYYYRIYALGLTPSTTFLSGNAATAAGVRCGAFTIGPTGTYPSIDSAITDLSINGLSCSVLLELQSTYVSSVERFPLVVPFFGGYSVKLRPAAGAINLSVISNSAQTFDLNGAAHFTIDGRPGGVGVTSQLTVYDSSLTGNTFRFINDANNDSLIYLVIKGATTGSTTNGVIQFSNSSTTAGNSNNLIDHCDITRSSSRPQVLIASANATNGAFSTGNAITNSLLHNWFSSTGANYAMNVGNGNSDWSIVNNSFYQDTIQTYNGTGATHIAINVTGGFGNNFSIRSNFIGGSAPQCGGSAWVMNGSATSRFTGISLNAGNTTGSVISNNTIKNFSLTTAGGGGGGGNTIWLGINVSGGKVQIGIPQGNVIGSLTANANILTTNSSSGNSTIGINTSSNDTVSIQNNSIGGMSALGDSSIVTSNVFGIVASSGNVTLSSNIIGSATLANSLSNNAGTTNGNNQVTGISCSNTNSTIVEANKIANLSNLYTGTSTGGMVRGIVTSGGLNIIRYNSVRRLSNASPQSGTGANASVQGIAQSSPLSGQVTLNNDIRGLVNTSLSGNVSVTGIYAGGSAGVNSISKNYIRGIGAPSDSSAAIINGIQLNSSQVVDNNMINLGTDTTGAVYAKSHEYNGILKSGAFNDNIYFNTVHIAGSVTGTGTSNTFAFRRTGNGTDTLLNNIFTNFRTNTASGGTHYSIALNNASTIKSNYNDLFGNGSGYASGLLGAIPFSNLSGWTTATGQDSSSVSVNPNYQSAISVYISNVLSSGIESRGVLIPTYLSDIDNDLRPGPIGSTNGGASAPDLGADEFDGIPVTVDMGTFALTSPTVTGCHTSAETVSISVKNYSTQTIDFAVDSLSVFASVTGINPVTFPVVTLHTGTLAAGAVRNVIINTTYNMAVAGFYNFSAHIVTQNDLLASNDTLSPIAIQISGGTATSSMSSICNGSSAMLTLTGASVGGSLQWQSSLNQSTWANLTGDTTAIVSVSPVVNTYYRAVKCGVYVSSVDSVHVINVNPPTPVGNSRCGFGQIDLHATSSNPVLWFDSLTGGSMLDTGTVFSPVVTGTTTFYAAAKGNPSSQQNLTTTFVGGRNSGGNMFTITAHNNITITGFDGQTGGGANDWAIYYRPDNFTNVPGSNLDTLGWILLGTDSGVVSAGAGLPTPIPIPLAINIPAGFTYSFYVLVTAGTDIIYSVGTGLGDANASNIDLQVEDGYAGTTFDCTAQPRVFNGIVHYYTNCISNRIPVVATVTPATPVIATTTDSVICSGDSLLFQVSSTNSNYDYSWTPTTGLRDTTGDSVWAIPTTSIYVVNAYDSTSGCATLDSIIVAINPTPNISITVNDDTICIGDTLHLAVNLPLSFRFGQGNQSNNQNQYPAPYGNFNWGARHQMLVRADEMLTAGMLPGNINSLAFNVFNSNGVSLKNFTLRIGSTSQTVLTDVFQTSAMQTVFTDTSYVPVNGINTHVFTSAFHWDGISNVLVETCFNDTTSTTNARTRWSTTSFPSCTYYSADTTTNCGEDTGLVTTQRPNIYFGIQNRYNIQWISTEALNDSNAVQPISIPNSSAVYHVTVTDSITGCIGEDSIAISVQPLPIVFLGNDSIGCGSVLLDAGNSGAEYLWSNNSTSQTLSVTADGIYAVNVTDSFSCSASDTIGITIQPLPVVSLALPFDSICSTGGVRALSGGLPVNGTYSGRGVSAGSIDPFIAGIGLDTITYTYVDNITNCENSATDTVLIVLCVGMQENVNAGNHIKVFPNPTVDDFTIEITDNQINKIELLNVDGKLIRAMSDFKPGKQLCSLRGFSSGVYFLKVTLTERVYFVKLLKEN